MTEAAIADSTGMKYLETLPRRVVTVYIPLALFVIVLLFPFYWMGVTTFKPNDELYNFADHNPFWISSPTLQNIRKLLTPEQQQQFQTMQSHMQGHGGMISREAKASS
jgi:multiple sugar transport system permease protein